MTSLNDGSATNLVQGRITFGVSKLWIPHVLLISFIYYVWFSPQQYHADQSAFWAPGAYIRALVGERIENMGVAIMWIVHLFEAGYTAILARRYKTTLVVGISYVVATLVFGKPGWEELSKRAQESSSSKVA